MSIIPTRNVAPTLELERDIRARVAGGHGANASEVVRPGLRRLIERDHQVLRSRSTVSAKPPHVR